jgi:hypothetical protein
MVGDNDALIALKKEFDKYVRESVYTNGQVQIEVEIKD